MSGMTLAALELAFRNWVKSKIPGTWKAVWADQNAPKLADGQVVLRRGNPYIRKIGRDVNGKVDPETLARSALGTRELTISLRAHGLGAIQLLEDIRTLFDDEMVADALIASKLTVVGSGDVQNLTTLYDSQFKEVANVDVVLRTHSLRELADAEPGVGYIETVDLEVTTQDPAGNETVEDIHVESPAE